MTLRGFVVAALAICAVGISGQSTAPAPVIWRIDNVAAIAGHTATRLGSPQVVPTDRGPAVAFNGRTDGLILDVNPLAGLSRFTVEVLFSPDVDGPEEQRFLHMQESTSENRALLELRQQKGGAWSLDSYLRYDAAQRTLIDRTLTHSAGDWHVATLTFDGQTMAHFIDGKHELSGPVAFRPLAPGRTSIGVRQNQISWFKGRIHTIRITPQVLPPDKFLPLAPLAPLALLAPAEFTPLWPEGVPDAKPDTRGEQWADGRVTIENSYLLVSALREAGVSVELHFYERGQHGFGVSPGLGATAEWPTRLLEWMSAHGWVGPPSRPTGRFGAVAPQLAPDAARAEVTWARGLEGQRKTDLGNG